MKNILSLCDGISCLQVALQKKGIEYDNYFAAEINQPAITITQTRFPKTIQLGDLRFITEEMLPKDVFIAGAGFPCKNTSLMGKKNGIVDGNDKTIKSLEEYLKLKNENHDFKNNQSYLFWEVIRILRIVKPKYIIIENTNMSKKWKKLISKELGIKPITINSSLVSAQNRKRLYWTNLPIPIINDKYIKLSDVIPGAIGGNGVRGRWNETLQKYIQFSTTRKDGKANCITTNPLSTGRVELSNGEIRPITVSEFEVLQTLPLGYTDVDGVCNTKRLECIGNSWTVDVITELIKNI